jgi:hypothetical protein
MINVNMTKAREITKELIRKDRTPKLEALDVSFMRAVEQGDVEAQTSIAAEKQTLRDATDDPRIANATTPEDLKLIIPS